jgi:hypothetical protein
MNWRQKDKGEGRAPAKQPKPPPTGQFCCWSGFALPPISGRLDVEAPGPEASIDAAPSIAAAACNLYFFILISRFIVSPVNERMYMARL